MKYPVAYDSDSMTIVIGPADADTDHDKVVSHLVFGEIGEVPDGSSHPEPAQHLRNIALQQGVDDYSLVTVENESGNDRLDRFAQQANDDNRARMEQREDMLVVDNPRYAHIQNASPDQQSLNVSDGEPTDDDAKNDASSEKQAGGEQGQATDQKPETAAQKKAREKAEADKAEKTA